MYRFELVELYEKHSIMYDRMDTQHKMQKSSILVLKCNTIMAAIYILDSNNTQRSTGSDQTDTTNGTE